MSDYRFVDAANQYARDVISGAIPACKWVRLLCERHLCDLDSQESEDFAYYFAPKKAERVAKFLQMLPHTKGKWASRRQAVKLEPWQIFAICVPFGWLKKSNDRRRYRTLYIKVPRKNGKSIIGAGLGLYMLTADGEFGAEVYSGATTEKQAWEVFRPAKLMAQRTPDLLEHFDVTVNASNICRMEDGSRLEPVIGNPGDGSSPSCAIVDEYHEHKDSRLFDTMETGMGSRDNPLMLVITTAGSNIGGPCYTLEKDAQKALDGVVDIPELWPVMYGLDEGDDWTSEESLRKANPNFGVSVDGDFLLSQLRAAMQSASKQATFRTKHLNEWVGAKNAFLNMVKWTQCPERKPLSELEGRPCFIGLDLASKVDVAATMLLFPPYQSDRNWQVHGRYYIPEMRVLEDMDSNTSRYREFHSEGLMTLTDGETIDFETIKEDLRDFASRFDLREVPYDPWQATQLSQEMMAEGLPMVELRQTVQYLSEPMKELESLVLQRKIAHGNCPVLTWMASNVVAKLDNKDNIYPCKERVENKIDGIVALIAALSRAGVHNDPVDIDDFLDNLVIA